MLHIGCDPEFFVKRDGKNISAHGLVPGTKLNPYRLINGAVQLDGTAIEFNTEPASSANQFESNINSVLGQIREMVPKEYEFDFTPAVEYDKEYFDKVIPDDSKELGCDPDWNAYTGKRQQPPVPQGTMRTGAGHLHIGWTNGADPYSQSHLYDCCTLVKNCDLLFTRIIPFWDIDKKRQRMYGRSGSFRPKSYGVEYRVPSNAWLRHPKLWPYLFETLNWIFEETVKGHYIPREGERKWKEWDNILYTHMSEEERLNKKLALYRSECQGAPALTEDMLNG